MGNDKTIREIKYMNIAKALGIVAVVIGHSGSPITHFIYQWHMALFYFISGYFYKDKYSKDPILLIKKRVKSLYLPYIKYGLLFLFLHNLFFRLNIYSDKVGYLDKVSHLYTKTEFLKNILSTFAFGTREQLLGVFWFIVSLFTVNILFCFISFFIERYYKEKNEITKESIRFIIILVCFTIGNLATFYNIKLYRFIDTSLVALSIYYLGYLYKRYEKIITMKLYYTLIALILLLLNSLYGSINVGLNIYLCPTFFLINSLTGIYIIIYCSKFLVSRLKSLNILEYIGENTLTIMALHFLSFKLINLLQIKYYNLPNYMLAKFPVINDNGLWWVAYSICGVFIPVGLQFIINKIKFNLVNKKVNL